MKSQLIAFTTITLSGYAISVFGGDYVGWSLSDSRSSLTKAAVPHLWYDQIQLLLALYLHITGISFLAFVWTVIFMLYVSFISVIVSSC